MAYKKITSYQIVMALLFLAFAATTAHAQPVTKPDVYPAGTLTNYIRTWNATAPENDPTALQSRPLKDAKQVTKYFDGLGRPLQTVIKQGSMATGGSPADMVSAAVYDSFGRQQYRYLPFASTASDGNFKTDPFAQQETFMNAQYASQGEQYFYKQAQFEASPLNRMTNTFAAGNSWVGTIKQSGNAQHGVGIDYRYNNQADSVQVWFVDNATGNVTNSGIYADGQLSETHTKNEQGAETVVYTDKDNEIILKKVQLAASPSTGHYGWLCTYYIYDDYGKQRVIIQPKGVELAQAASWQLSATVLNEFCYQYAYDQRLRMVYKKMPGASAVNLVYDVKDRLVLVQDGNMAAAGKWMYTLYDTLDRTVSTGLWTTTATPATLQAAAYSSGNYPDLSGQTYEELSDTYYDDYSWASSHGSSLANFNTGYASSFIQAADNSTWPYPQAVTQSSLTMGMVTGNRVKVLGTSTYLATVVFYDDKGRTIQKRMDNNLGGVDVSTSQYAWSGAEITSVVQHQKTGTNAQTHVVATVTAYDDLFRPSTTTKTINSTINGVTLNTPAKVLDSMYYDKLGQLVTKVFSPSFKASGLQRSNFDYNIRGWLLGMNRSFIAAAAAPITANTNDFFGYELGYDQNPSFGGSWAGLQYSGNMSGTTWKSIGDNKQRRYDYSYDNANRLLKADFNQWTGSAFNKSAGVDFSMQMGDGSDPLSAYDANGNILSMQQMGLTTAGSIRIDSLVYTYQNSGTSNKLAKVSDGSASPTNDGGHGLGDFKDGSNTGDDYVWDANGNMVTDNNKGIAASGGGNGITYNYLNLPETIAINPQATAAVPKPVTGSIAYTYDARGDKLRKMVTENDSTGLPAKMTITEYAGSFAYQSSFTAPFTSGLAGNDLQYIANEDGRSRYVPLVGTTAAHFAYDYFLKDYLGNTRMVLTDEDPDEVIPKLSMEKTDSATNTAYFSNIISSKTIKPNNFNCQVYITYPDTISYAAKVTGVDTAYIGPAAFRRVMNGDSLTLKVESYYRTHDNNASLQPALTAAQSQPNLLKQVAAALVQSGYGLTLAQLQASTVLQNSVTAYLNGLSVASGKPQAGVYWLTLDQQLNYVAAASGFSQVGTGGCGALNPAIPTCTANGYMFLFVANQTQQLFVYYDNLQLTHIHSPVVEETQYYPYGLAMQGISSRSAGRLENKFKYTGNELQSGEFSDGTGLEQYDMGARFYDQQTGRYTAMDPLTEYMRRWNPYASNFDNPVRFTDPGGMVGDDPKAPVTPAAAQKDTIDGPEMNVNVTPNNNVTVTKDDESPGFFRTLGHLAWAAIDYIPVAGSIKQIGVGIYHGDWKEIALGTVSLAVDAFTLGEGGEAVRLAEQGAEVLAKDEVEELGEKALAENLEKDAVEDEAEEVAGEAASGCGCFLPGTKVLTDSGYVPIERIKKGDMVWAYNDTTHQYAKKKVINVFEHVRDTVYQLHIGSELVNTTSDHPFFVGGRWLRVKDLHVGDSVATYRNTKVAIGEIQVVYKRTVVHNFEVEDYHTYYVSEQQFLVHNNKCATGGETNAAKVGREKHAELSEKVKQKEGWKSEPRIKGADGKYHKPDIKTPSGNFIELKPNTASGIKKGISQAKRYEKQLGEKTRVIYYNP